MGVATEDIAACEGEDGRDLPDNEEEGDNGGLPKRTVGGNLTTESPQAGESERGGDVGNEGDAPDVDCTGGSSLEEEGAEGVQDGGEERQPKRGSQEKVGRDGGGGCQGNGKNGQWCKQGKTPDRTDGTAGPRSHLLRRSRQFTLPEESPLRYE